MSPIEANTRKLVGVLAEFPAAGSSCGDLRERFERVTGRKHATFYACLQLAKAKGWIVSDGGIYTLNPNGCWRDSPEVISEQRKLERHQFEHVLTKVKKLESANRKLTDAREAIAAGGEAAGPAISALMAIMCDSGLSTRARLQAAENLLAYRAPPEVTESAKMFLASGCTNPEMNVDHRLAATTALRRSEDARIMPPIERPSPARTDNDAEPPIPLLELVRQRRERADRMQREMEREIALQSAANIISEPERGGD